MPVGAQPPPSLRTLPDRNARIFKKTTPTPTVSPTPTNEPPLRATLEVSPPPPVDVNAEVTFFVVPKLPRAVEYRFHFGDGKTSDWITPSQTTHRYFESKIYLAYAEIRGREGLLAHGTNTPRREVKVVQRSNPTPSATVPARITPSPTASATASVPISPSPYSPSPTTTVAGGSITAPPLRTTPSPASPTATRSPPEQSSAPPTSIPSNGGSASRKKWWIFYVVSAGLAAVALYGIPKLIKPTLHPHADWDAPQRPPQNLAINYGLYLHSNVSAGQDRLQTDGPRLILRKRTQ
jgi:hypothetical protein